MLERLLDEKSEQYSRLVREAAVARRATEAAHLDTIRRLVVAAEFKDQSTAEHIVRIGRYCEVVAWFLGLPSRDVETIREAAPMHDVGKIGVPDSILRKTRPLDGPEWT